MQTFQERVRAEMLRQGISLRELGRRSRIHHSLLSRVLRGEVSPTPALLARLAPALDLPAALLYREAGLHASTPMEDALRSMGVADDLSEDALLRHLEGLQLEARTPRGRRRILREFPRKRRETGPRGPIANCLDALYAAYCRGSLPPGLESEVGAALLYFIQPADCIPDDHFPFGYLDDAMVVQLVWPKLAMGGEPMP